MKKCPLCGGELEQKTVTHPQEYQGRIIILENVPADVCRQCAIPSAESLAHGFLYRPCAGVSLWADPHWLSFRPPGPGRFFEEHAICTVLARL